MNKLSKIIAALLLIFLIGGCDLFELDINDDPNNPTSATPDLLLANIELQTAENLAAGVNSNMHGFVGLTASADRYQLSAGSYNGLWNNLYSGVFKDVDNLIKASEKNDAIGQLESPRYLGIAQTLKAYIASTMVDMFGDIPYSEAAKGDDATSVRQPKFDKDSDVYAEVFKLLDEAIVNLGKPSPVTVNGDLIYGGNGTKWLQFAKSLKLKLLIQTRLVNSSAGAEISKLISEGGLITSTANDFQFQFSRGDVTSPDNRHPWYTGAYTGGGFDDTYVLHQILVEMLEDEDPRFPFYFKRQTTSILNLDDPSERNTAPCNSIPCPYGYLVANPSIYERLFTAKGKTPTKADTLFLAGLFGHDRSDPSGIPNDGSLRLLPGVFPAGGYHDANPVGVPAANKAPGAGIFPILTSVNVSYYQIEAILAGLTTGDAKALFEKAMRDHIKKVVDFGASLDATAAANRPTQAAIDKYVTLWLTRFDEAVSNNAKLNIVAKQLWFSSWGNGYEIYNMMRRTGFPNNIQEPIVPLSRQFALRLPYPQDEITLNPNAKPYAEIAYDKVPIFWDK